ARALDELRRIGLDRALADEELEEAPDRRELPGARARRLAAAAGRDDEVEDARGVDEAHVGCSGSGVDGELAEIARGRRERVGRERPLDPEVIEVAVDPDVEVQATRGYRSGALLRKRRRFLRPFGLSDTPSADPQFSWPRPRSSTRAAAQDRPDAS